MKPITLISIVLLISGCVSAHKPPQPDRKVTWLINDADSYKLIEKKIAEDDK